MVRHKREEEVLSAFEKFENISAKDILAFCL
jgi:hypothetical protein